MKLIITKACAVAILVVCGGCAHGPEETGGSRVSYNDQEPGACDKDVGERAYRNQFLRARHIGQSCAE